MYYAKQRTNDYYVLILIYFFIFQHLLLMKLLAIGLITFFINGNPVFRNGPSNLPKSPPDCIILDNWVCDNFISVDKWFEKALRKFETCLLVNNNLWGKLVSLSPIIFDDNLKTTSVSFFIADFSLLSCEFDSFKFNLLYCVTFMLTKIKRLYDIHLQNFYSSFWKIKHSFFCFFKNEIESCISCSI